MVVNCGITTVDMFSGVVGNFLLWEREHGIMIGRGGGARMNYQGYKSMFKHGEEF